MEKMKNMKQEEIGKVEAEDTEEKPEEKPEQKKWVKDEDEAVDAEQIKLDVGESVEGLLLDKFDFEGGYGKRNWGYIIKVKDKDHPVLLFGCTMLNNKMLEKQVSTEIYIERMPDQKNKAGMSYQVYETYHMA